MAETLSLIHERVDDIPLLIGLMQQLKLVKVLDEHLGNHAHHQGASNGTIAMVWLAYILSEGDHRKSHVQEWAERHRHSLERLLGFCFRAVEFNDDRLGLLLHRFSKPGVWEAIEEELWEQAVLVYEVEVKRIRLDSTTTYGYHQVNEEGIMQLGYSKDHRPDLPQLKLMAAAAEPSGYLLGSEVYSGESSDDGLYIPMIQRVGALLSRKATRATESGGFAKGIDSHQPVRGLLYCGDSKMSALPTRAHIAREGNFYLTVLPLSHENSGVVESWIARIVEGEEPARLIWQGEEVLAGGYEFSRALAAKVNGQEVDWSERVAVIRSVALAARQDQQLEARLSKAEEALKKLTPGKGKPVYEPESALQEAISAILKQYKVEGLLNIGWEKQQTTRERFIGQGRPGPARPKCMQTLLRYAVREVSRNQQAIESQKHRHGWQILISNIPAEYLPFEELLLAYRGGWCLERDNHLLKDKPLGIRPLYVRNDDQIRGLTYLLTIALRILTLIEIQVRQGLRQNQQVMRGLYPGLPKKASDRPTAPLLLKAISKSEITLTQFIRGEIFQWHLTPLPELVTQVLGYLKLSSSIYTCLIENST